MNDTRKTRNCFVFLFPPLDNYDDAYKKALALCKLLLLLSLAVIRGRRSRKETGKKCKSYNTSVCLFVCLSLLAIVVVVV